MSRYEKFVRHVTKCDNLTQIVIARADDSYNRKRDIGVGLEEECNQ